MNVLTINLLFSTFVFWIAARLYVLPRLHTTELRTLLLPILLLHAFRHLGLMFLSSGATYPGLAREFTAIAKPLVWIFNLEGSIDLAAAITLATVYDAERSMGPIWSFQRGRHCMFQSASTLSAASSSSAKHARADTTRESVDVAVLSGDRTRAR